ncbi:hypothetical protein, partial [Puniceibacterium sediminis]|uniref:hypothetical protein n=1 Tax=Puniceibacterium sediminis TaxID=1608407 RepID=UPI001C3C465F
PHHGGVVRCLHPETQAVNFPNLRRIRLFSLNYRARGKGSLNQSFAGLSCDATPLVQQERTRR